MRADDLSYAGALKAKRLLRLLSRPEIDSEINAAVVNATEAAEAAATASQIAKDAAESARDAAVFGADIYPDETTGRAAVNDGELFRVVGTGDVAARLLRRVDAGTSEEITSFPSVAAITDLKSAPSKNLFDRETTIAGSYFSVGSQGIINSPSWRRSGHIPIKPGATYTLSGLGVNPAVGFFGSTGEYIAHHQSSSTFTAPAGAVTAVFNVTNKGQADTSFDYSAQLELGSVATPYSPFKPRIPVELVAGIPDPNAAIDSRVLLGTGKNLFDKTRVQINLYFSLAASAVIVGANWRCSHLMPVDGGKTYVVSGTQAVPLIAWFGVDGNFLSYNSGVVGTAPGNAAFAVVNICSDGSTASTETAQFEIGTVATAYEPFRRAIAQRDVSGLTFELGSKVNRSDILEQFSFNAINPDACDYVRRYTIANTGGFITDTLGLCVSNRVRVYEGEWYCLSGSGVYVGAGAVPQGGYLTSENASAPLQNIGWTNPVSGPGHAFQVPVGLGITHVVVSIWKAGREVSGRGFDGPVQLEPGEMATPHQPYSPRPRVRPDLVVGLGGNPGSAAPQASALSAEAWYKFVVSDNGASLVHRLPTFRHHWLVRDKDVCVVTTGTSLTARSTEHCTDHPDAAIRPPLMHSRNTASLLWDMMRWDGQQYRRYDASGFFAETGNWATQSNLPEWDDGAYRAGLTRYADGPASVACTFPADAWQCNFIYRSDSAASESVTLSVADGTGFIQVHNGTEWIEANGYIFSMREPTPVTRVVSVPTATTGLRNDRTLASKGNTTYQKRLRMRTVSRGTARTVTLSASTGRLLYWGVEWSPRQYMLTYVNASRGSHNTNANGGSGLPRYADNEVWGFKPDLILTELPIHNDGIHLDGPFDPLTWIRYANDYLLRDDYELSMTTRAAAHGLSPEIALFSSSIAWNFNGINEDGTLKMYTDSDGAVRTALDRWRTVFDWLAREHPEVVAINSVQRWCEAGVAIHGNLRAATEGSGKGGATFTNEGSHWNDTGSRIIAKALAPLFNFVH